MAKRDTDIAIEVQDVTKYFKLYYDKPNTLKERLVNIGRNKTVKRTVLDHINLTIKKGETVALIGTNGSGKSTMLKVIAGVLKPTRGIVEVRGTIAPLIELGAGFDMDLTASENIFLNGALLGYSRKDMEKEYDNIVEFSELHDFMNVPVKNFSSGMVSRLAFAIATIGQPDILICDEVLSVGDFRFQEKCQKRIKAMLDRGTTLLFVSHSIEQVEELCDKIVWLEKGTRKMFGDAKEIAEIYRNS